MTRSSEQPKEYIYWKDAKPEDFENVTTSCWIEDVGDISTEYERKFIQRFGVALRTLFRPHTPAPGKPRPPCEECVYQARSVEHDAQVAKAEREQVLESIHKRTFQMRHRASSEEVNNEAVVLDYSAVYELLQSLRTQPEPQQ